MRPFRALTALVLLLIACEKSSKPTPGAGTAAGPVVSDDTTSHPAWSKSATIYEVNVRQYTPAGTLAAFEPNLPRLKNLGVDILWFMPLQPIGKKNRKGALGSYYSISNYTAFNPEFGTKADFKRIVDAAHAQGMKVILDWVANHTSFDHEWIASHKDYYELKADSTVMNARDNEGHATDWTDVAELNYGNPKMRSAMIDAMRWWIDEFDIDGFRCDVAGGVPMDFWVEARTQLQKRRSDLFMLAEAEDPKFHPAFDMTYGWELHHLLNDIAQGKKPTSTLDAYFANQERAYGSGAFRMYFTSNHDENSWNGSEFERMGANHAPAFILAATAERSMPLLYTGQEASVSKRLRFFEKDTVDWNGRSLAGFYAAVFDLKHREPALANGAWGAAQRKLDTDGGDRVYAYTRARGKNAVIVAVNFGDATKKLAYHALADTGVFKDWFSNAALTLGTSGSFELPAHGYRVLVK